MIFFTFNFLMLVLLHKPQKAVRTFRASPWYEQSCCRLGALENQFGRAKKKGPQNFDIFFENPPSLEKTLVLRDEFWLNYELLVLLSARIIACYEIWTAWNEFQNILYLVSDPCKIGLAIKNISGIYKTQLSKSRSLIIEVMQY